MSNNNFEESSSLACISKLVTFAPTATMRFALHINDYTIEETYACFYGRSEYMEFQQDAKRTVRKMEMKRRIDKTTESTRGVEFITRDAVKARVQARRLAAEVVLTEQRKQLLEDWTRDHDKVAALYSNAVRESAVSAYLKGLSDARTAQNLIQEKNKLKECRKKKQSRLRSKANTNVDETGSISEAGTIARVRIEYKSI